MFLATLQFLLDGSADKVRPTLAVFKNGVYPVQRPLWEAGRGLLVVDLFSAHWAKIDDITNYYKPNFVDISY